MAGEAAIFPGQGAQLVGMGRDVAAENAAARDTFQEADQTLGFQLSALCFEGPSERLNATDIQQPAIFATSVALFRAALDRGLFIREQFAAMGGLSLGEYAALHLADAINFQDALKLVQRRGKLMQQACEQSPGGMASLIGMDEDRARRLCAHVASSGAVAPANFNCPGQIVISGDKAAIEAACAAAGDFGGRAIPLDVAGAFHSPLMQGAADELREALRATEFRTPAVRVIANVDAEYHSDPDAIRERLYRQVFNPVRWQACVERVIADGCERFWEVGPNRVLTGMMRKIDRTRKTINVSKASDLTPASQ